MRAARAAGGIALLGVLLAAAPAALGAGGDELVRELLRSQSATERGACASLQGVIARGADALLAVRTAIELGYNPCQTIRCALEAGAPLDKVVYGAAQTGVTEDVIARCAVAAGADAAAVAALLADFLADPNFCYFSLRPGPPVMLPTPPVVDRRVPPPQVSPFAF